MKSEKIPFVSLTMVHSGLKKDFLSCFEDILNRDWYILGKECSEFEREFASFIGAKHCISIGNGLDALVISLKALGITNPSDEVIVPVNSFIASALAVSLAGAKPVFAEPDYRTYNLTAKEIEKHITKNTRAIMPVHLYGQACEMTEILELCQKYGLSMIEDNAQAQGASYHGQITGTFGILNGTSFYPGKNLGALGDAGAITTNDSDLAEKVKKLRSYGGTVKYHHDELGQNSRLDEIQASFLRRKLPLLTEWNRIRNQQAEYYSCELSNVGDLILPYTSPGATHVYHLYIIRTQKRDQLREYLTQKNIETLIHYPIPIHLQKAYETFGFKKGSFPIAEELANTILSLPIYPGLAQHQQDRIICEIRNFFNQ